MNNFFQSPDFILSYLILLTIFSDAQPHKKLPMTKWKILGVKLTKFDFVEDVIFSNDSVSEDKVR